MLQPFITIYLILWLSIVSSASLIDDILAALRNMKDCTSCLQTLVPLRALATFGDDIFVSTINRFCIARGIADPDVCAGAISASGPIVSHDLRRISLGGQSARRLCTALFGFCFSKNVTEFTVPLPPRPRSPKRPKINDSAHSETFKVVHISDVHIDREYTTGAEANCTKPICCRNFGKTTDPVSVPAGPNGSRRCDTPVSLSNNFLDAVQSIGAKFVIFTGDIVEAAVWLVDQSETITDLEEFNAQLASRLDIPVYPSFGNHDVAPVNAFQRNTSGRESQWAFNTQSAGWKQWIGSTASEQVKYHSGSYSSRVPGTNLVILSINTQYWYRQNFWLYDSDTFQPDPNGVLAFMVEQLHEAESRGDRVWIIGHIPLGVSDALVDQSNYYDQILQRYHRIIAGQFFGHTHMDQFTIAYSNYSEQTADNAVSTALTAPALTPRGGNPGFRVYDVKSDTFEVMDAHSFFTNTSDPSFQTTPKWNRLYSVRETYGPLVGLPHDVPLTPAFWHNLTEVFKVNDTAFQLYRSYAVSGRSVSFCDTHCKNTIICDIKAFRSENNCDAPTPHIIRGRGDISSSGGFTECGQTTIGDVLVDIAAREMSGSYLDSTSSQSILSS